jgi:hypothetical protein
MTDTSGERERAAYEHLPSDHESITIALELYEIYISYAPPGGINKNRDPSSSEDDSAGTGPDSSIDDPDYVEKVKRTKTEPNRFGVDIRDRHALVSQLTTPTRPSGSSTRSGGSKRSGQTVKSSADGPKVGDKRRKCTCYSS